MSSNEESIDYDEESNFRCTKGEALFIASLVEQGNECSGDIQIINEIYRRLRDAGGESD